MERKLRLSFCILMLLMLKLVILPARSTLEIMPDSVDALAKNTIKPKEVDPQNPLDDQIFWHSYIRLRHEFWNNQEDLNNDLDDLFSFFRLKLYLGGGFRPTKNTEIYARIINESRYYGHKGTGDTIRNDHFYRPERHYFELVFGQLHFKWNKIAGLPLSLKLGRQYLHDEGFGDTWLIGDGTPLDGSKTFYYNAARFTYRFNRYTSLDLVGLASFANDPLVIVSEIEESATNITNEQGGWLWFKHRINEWFPYHAYYLFKHETGGGGFHREEISNIHTAGFHIKPEIRNFWLSAQAAVQSGNYGAAERTGFGTILYGGFQYRTGKSHLKAGPWYMYHTGDDPNTPGFEAFNNLFGGYPNDDELYLNTWMQESGLSMWTNINLLGAYLEYHPRPNYNLRFWYHYMHANQPVNGSFFGNGKFRGHMIMFKGIVEIGKRLSAYYMFEYLWPGSFYNTGADNSILSRINLEWHF